MIYDVCLSYIQMYSFDYCLLVYLFQYISISNPSMYNFLDLFCIKLNIYFVTILGRS